MDKFQDVSDLSDLLSSALTEAHSRVMDQNNHVENQTKVEASFMAYSIAISSMALTIGIPKDNFIKLIDASYDKVRQTWEDYLKEHI